MKLEDLLYAEATEYEFKSQLEKKRPKSWLKSVCAFANGIGGSIFLGVSDDGNIIGLSNAEKDITFVSEKIKEKIEPMVIYDVNLYVMSNGEQVVRLYIRSGQNTPYYYSSDGNKIAFIRSGNQSIGAPTNILNELVLRGQNKTYDSLDTNYSLSDLSFNVLEVKFKSVTKQTLDKMIDFSSFGLLNNQCLSNAGVLLADHSPIRQSRVFCTRWSGLEKGSVFDDAIDDKEYSGDLLSLVEGSKAFVKNNSSVKWVKSSKGRIDRPDYPEIAVHEVVINSIIHRDYNLLGTEIHIDMYDDRLEIISPGGMYDGRKIQDIDISKVSSIRRNPIIADLFHRLKLMERRGSGLQKISREFTEEFHPEFYSSEIEFKVILRNMNFKFDKIEKENKDSSSRLNSLIKFCSIPRSAQDMMDFLNLKDRKHFRNSILNKLLEDHLIELTIPNKPRSSLQKYKKC